MISNLARKLLPNGAKEKLSEFYYEQKLFKAARTLANARGLPGGVLDEKAFYRLLKQYPVGQPMQYDDASVLQRGQERAVDMLASMQNHGTGTYTDVLELGAGEAMVSAQLQQAGKKVTAIEFRDDDFDLRAEDAGVALLKMDAAALSFDDNSFDFVFSYNCFEHFPKPDVVFSESLRVLRKGGLMSIRFAPLYHSPWGAHAYNIIGIPYCQFLFDKTFLNHYFSTRSSEKFIMDATLNRWHVDKFRKIWNLAFKDRVKVRYYKEFRAPFFLDLVIDHPGCFKNKITTLDDLVVSEIHAVFEKI
jgi:ubiquinone/menaquinone biosynthesis C-methylase UbiE